MIDKEYKFAVHSPWRVILVCIILFSLFLMNIDYIDSLIGDEKAYILFILIFLFQAISFYLAHLLTRGKVHLKLNNKGLYHVWDKRFLFNKEKDLFIPQEGMVEFRESSYKAFNTIEIRLSNGIMYKQNRLNIFTYKDDYKTFVKDIKQYISNHVSNTDKTQE